VFTILVELNDATVKLTNVKLLLLVIPLLSFAVIVLMAVGLIWWKTTLLLKRRQHTLRNTFMDKVLLTEPDSKLCDWRDEYSGCTGSGSG